MNNSVYRMGFQDGLQEAQLRGEVKGKLRALAYLYERRLQRPLTEAEQAALAQRVEKLSLDRLLDVREQLSPEVLATWLGDPAAT